MKSRPNFKRELIVVFLANLKSGYKRSGLFLQWTMWVLIKQLYKSFIMFWLKRKKWIRLCLHILQPKTTSYGQVVTKDHEWHLDHLTIFSKIIVYETILTWNTFILANLSIRHSSSYNKNWAEEYRQNSYVFSWWAITQEQTSAGRIVLDGHLF